MRTGNGVQIKKSPWARDLAAAAVVTLVGTAALMLVDAFDYLHAVSREYEHWNLDEIVLGLGVLALSSVWFAWRRQREAWRHLSDRDGLERDLGKNYEELSFLISASPGVLYICEPEGDFAATFVSPRMKAQSGYDPDDFMSDSKFWADHIHPEDKERVFAELGSLFERGHHTHEYRFRNADGSYRWIHDQLTLFRDSDGKPERIAGFWLDITDRKEFERHLAAAVDERTAELSQANEALRKEVEERARVAEKLKEREAESARLIESLPGFVYLCDYDEDWTMRFVSEAVRGILGYAPDELIGNRAVAFGDLIHPDDQEAIWVSAERNLAERKPCEHKYRVRTASGSEKTVWERSHGVYDEAGEVVRIEGYIEDITDRKRIEEQLYQTQKMEAVGQLTGGIAHEFNNMLAAIIGNLEILGGRLKDDARAKRPLETALKAASRAAELVRRLLAFSRRQYLEREVMDLREVLSRMRGLLQITLTEAVELEMHLAEDLRSIRADPAQLEIAILNLAINARDAMPNGGRLVIESTNVKLDAAHAARHPDATPGSYVELAVSDNGPGMSPEVKERVFEPFFTTKEVGQGTGLGLSMVYGLLKQLDGHVTLYSEEGHGTCIKLYLPVAEASETVSSGTSASRDDCPGGTETVLVVEDDIDMRETVVAILEGLGYRVLSAGIGAAGLALLEEHRDIDLLFTDIVMPGGMSGLDLARKASDRMPGLKVLLTSGYSEKAFVRDGKSGHHNEWIAKPYFKGALAQKVRQVLDKPRA